MPNWKRRQLIADLIRRGPITSQRQLVEALDGAGDRVTQATVSRELAALGVVKGPGGYSLPDDLPGATAANGRTLETAMRTLALSADAAASMVVVRTPAGHAPALAAAIDRAPPAGCVGTLAGDDTIFMATTSASEASRVTASLRRMINGGNARR